MNWSFQWMLLSLLCSTACNRDTPPDLAATVGPHVVELTHPEMTRIDLLDGDGAVIETRRFERPEARVKMHTGWLDGVRSVRIHSPVGQSEVPLSKPDLLGPFELRIDAPMGQGPEPTADQQVLNFTLVKGATAQVAVTVQVHEAGDYVLRIGQTEQRHPNTRSGTRLVMVGEVAANTPVSVDGPTPDHHTTATLNVQPIEAAWAQDRLRLVAMPFPVDSRGQPELARPSNRVTLPAKWWREILKRTTLGARNWGQYEPWGHQAVILENAGDQPLNVAIRSVITDDRGVIDPVFNPRFRDVDSSTGETSVLLRIPANQQATAVLPIYVDDPRIPDAHPPNGWRRVIEVTPLGLDTPIITAEQPLFVSRGNTTASLGLWISVLGAFAGLGLAIGRWRNWLTERPTTQLMTIAMFGALMFLAQTGGQLLGMGMAALLGPFSTLLTGLVDDAFRTALLVTLLMLAPRPGTAALAALVEGLLGALALGQVGPAELLILGNRVFWVELCLWLTGVTRDTAWTEGPVWVAWARTSLGLGLANLATAAFGLVISMVLYRFYYSTWFVVMVLAGPSFLYVLIGCALALPFARSLREVAP
jgi:hypothetical protein